MCFVFFTRCLSSCHNTYKGKVRSVFIRSSFSMPEVAFSNIANQPSASSPVISPLQMLVTMLWLAALVSVILLLSVVFFFLVPVSAKKAYQSKKSLSLVQLLTPHSRSKVKAANPNPASFPMISSFLPLSALLQLSN